MLGMLSMVLARAATPGEDLGIARYRAVLFSAQDYSERSHIPDLHTPNRDVEEIGRVLKDRFGFEVEIVADATEEQILGRLKQLKEDSTEQDAVLIYFAGHGQYDKAEDEAYWLPADADADNPSAWISSSTVSATIKAMPARHVLLVVDSCFGGRFAGVRAVRSIEVQPFEEQVGFEVALRFAQKRSRAVLTSGANEPVEDGGLDGMSVFAYQLREAMQQGEREFVYPEALWLALRDPVVDVAHQTPQFNYYTDAFHGGGALVMEDRCGKELAGRRDEVVLRADEDWKRIGGRGATDPEQWRSYVERWGREQVMVCDRPHPVEVPHVDEARQLRADWLDGHPDPCAHLPVLSRVGIGIGAVGLAALGSTVLTNQYGVLPARTDGNAYREHLWVDVTKKLFIGGASGAGAGLALITVPLAARRCK